MLTVLLVFVAGGVGCVLRFLLSQATASLNSSYHFPIGTLCCNVVGCFLIGLFCNWAQRFGWDGNMKTMLTVGLCGGFTTFSTFSNESLSLLNEGAYPTYILYVASSIFLGLAFVVVGMKL